jgi:hypothetical protein
MSLPVRLGVGLVSIYGAGSINSIINTGQESGIRYGIVNAMYNQYGKMSIGQSVMYNMNDVIAPTFYIDAPYFILPEDKVISVEDNITPP